MPETPLPPSGDGTVVLEIGGEVGALVVHTPPELDGHEIDLFPIGSTIPCMHSAVRRRDVWGQHRWAAVYPAVAAGDYTLAGSSQALSITGGMVTELEYRSVDDPLEEPLHSHSHEHGHEGDAHAHRHEGHSHEGHAHEGHSHAGHGHSHEGHELEHC